jgi:hypothetical protein
MGFFVGRGLSTRLYGFFPTPVLGTGASNFFNVAMIGAAASAQDSDLREQCSQV